MFGALSRIAIRAADVTRDCSTRADAQYENKIKGSKRRMVLEFRAEQARESVSLSNTDMERDEWF